MACQGGYACRYGVAVARCDSRRGRETTDEAETASSEELSTKDGESQKSRIIKAIQALTVFVVMFVVLYVLLKWMTSKDEM